MQLKMVLPGDTNEIIEEREMFALSHIKNKKVVGLTSFLQQHSAAMVFSFTVPDTRAVAVSFDQRTGCCKDLRWANHWNVLPRGGYLPKVWVG